MAPLRLREQKDGGLPSTSMTRLTGESGVPGEGFPQQPQAARSTDDEHRIHEINCRTAEVFDAGVHIEQENIVLAEEQMREQSF